ncbi:predicted protein [Methanosarcina acetivorans C2A]|uniref:Uncharacterized protein n=1 Tax=Methanosarcina acetivorans (strain ATCC 35395 / DSM 2834 / JCM 12185 / C2A) TaxID=188937 RepID=Q8TKU1_METAC|nr:predicted protein [Methanosarcina acetivorans C2A]
MEFQWPHEILAFFGSYLFQEFLLLFCFFPDFLFFSIFALLEYFQEMSQISWEDCHSFLRFFRTIFLICVRVRI